MKFQVFYFTFFRLPPLRFGFGTSSFSIVSDSKNAIASSRLSITCRPLNFIKKYFLILCSLIHWKHAYSHPWTIQSFKKRVRIRHVNTIHFFHQAIMFAIYFIYHIFCRINSNRNITICFKAFNAIFRPVYCIIKIQKVAKQKCRLLQRKNVGDCNYIL